MAKKLYIGNLSFDSTEDDLNGLFEGMGAVEDIFIVRDKFTGKSRGFAFVTMSNDQEADEAIERLNEQDFLGRNIIVNEARPQENRAEGGGGGFRSGGGGGGGGFRSGGGGGGRSSGGRDDKRNFRR